MRTRIVAVVLLFWFAVAAGAAHAQERCSLQTFSGTYVSVDRGSSTTIDLSSTGVLGPAPGLPPSPPAWVAPGIVPFINIALVTYTPDGIGDGYFWMSAGSLRATLEPIPLHITVTELNEDCTGKFRYTLANGVTIEERIIVFDNGRQYRSVPTTIASPGIPTLAWIGTGHRISQGSAPVNSCGPQTARGSYLMSFDAIAKSGLYPTMAVAEMGLLRTDVSMAGDYTGVLYEKYGAASIDGRPVWGTVTVNPDCSFASTLNVEGLAGSTELRGFFFNEGKEYYGMGILNPTKPPEPSSIKYSFCHGTRIGQ